MLKLKIRDCDDATAPVFPSGEWVLIAHESEKGKVCDSDIYFYVDNDVNFSRLKPGCTIELDENFFIMDIDRSHVCWQVSILPTQRISDEKLEEYKLSSEELARILSHFTEHENSAIAYLPCEREAVEWLIESGLSSQELKRFTDFATDLKLWDGYFHLHQK